jgi:hypothetical protein
MSLKRIGDLEIDEDIEWEQGEWTFERIGWGLMAVFILIAMAGLFGSGPLSHRIAGQEGGSFWVEYQRFIRYNSPQELHIYVSPEWAADGELRMVIEGDFPGGNQQLDVTPDPDSVELSTGRLVYVWQTAEATGPMQIVFHYYPFQRYSQTSRIGPEGGNLVDIEQFVYP